MSERARRARHGLDEAAAFLESFRREAGVESAPETAAARGAAETSLRAALEAARARLEELARDLEAERERARPLREEAERLRRELAARPEPGAAETARAEAEERARRVRAELEARCASLEERLTLAGAERVRVESLRRKAEQGAAEAEGARRSIEDALRRELRTAHAALDRAAAEAGAREAKAKGEIDPLRARLESALLRLEQLERERRAETAQAKAAVAAAALEARQSEEAVGRAQAVTASLRRDLEAARTQAADKEQLLRERIRELTHAEPEEEEAPPVEEPASLPEPASPADFVVPPLEPLLEPGWGRLLRLLRPPIEAAYAHLRRLSQTPLKTGPKSLVRLAASSIGSAADSLASIELALADGPPPTQGAPVLGALEQALAAWEPALRKRAIVLVRELPRALPEAVCEPAALRVLLYHVLRNSLEAMPRGGRLTVKGARGPEGALCLEFTDDGPGFPAAWLERRFEPFASPRAGRAGLGLSIVRRTLRRWGGEAEASNGPGGRGARLTLTFAVPPAPGPVML